MRESGTWLLWCGRSQRSRELTFPIWFAAAKRVAMIGAVMIDREWPSDYDEVVSSTQGSVLLPLLCPLVQW
jgi:hypothetical protein